MVLEAERLGKWKEDIKTLNTGSVDLQYFMVKRIGIGEYWAVSLFFGI